jgi:hypothetical protein
MGIKVVLEWGLGLEAQVQEALEVLALGDKLDLAVTECPITQDPVDPVDLRDPLEARTSKWNPMPRILFSISLLDLHHRTIKDLEVVCVRHPWEDQDLLAELDRT